MEGLGESGPFTGSDSPFFDILQDSNAKMQDSKAFLSMFRHMVLRRRMAVFPMGEYGTVLMDKSSLHAPGGRIRKERPVLGEVGLMSGKEVLTDQILRGVPMIMSSSRCRDTHGSAISPLPRQFSGYTGKKGSIFSASGNPA
jgi:hypothetical protein